ncbi:MAG: peptidoglycan D,D-transpeptidase FtsI family protein [Tepidisphaeraceae bacterium]
MFERRLHVLLLFLAFFCVVVAVRAVTLQALQRSVWEDKASHNLIDEEQLPTTRGRILDVKGRELAIDQPCIDACVDSRAIPFEPDSAWVRNTARSRLKLKIDHFNELPLADRKKLLDSEMIRVKDDINTMWSDLARLSKQTPEQMDEIRRQIVRQVETRRRLVWYRKYKSAAASQPSEPRWYDWLVGKTQVTLDNFADVHVAEETQQQVILPHIDYALRNELNRNIDHYPGLKLREGVTRVYPYGAVACQAIGRLAPVTPDDIVNDPNADDSLAKYDASDRIGREGMERMFEERLRGTRGLRVTDDDGKEIPGKCVAPVPGQDVHTTIDIKLEAQIEQAFKNVSFVVNTSLPMQQLEMPGAAVVVDVPTGQVRALVSWPTYDLNAFDDLFPKLVKDAINRPLMNRATMMAVEPGSTVKPIVGIGAITSGVIKPIDTIRCDGFLTIGNHTYTTWGKCWTQEMYHMSHMQLSNPPPSPDLTFPEALQRSCNVFHETLGYRLGIGGLSYWFDKFGLGRPTGIGLPEAKGLLPDSEAVPPAQRLMRTCVAGIGEGHVAATPVQMANVAATIARNGFWMRPTLQPDKKNPPIDLHLNPEAVAEAHEGMKEVVNTPAGSGYIARMRELIYSGKTGSAQTSAFTVTRRDDDYKPLRDERGRVIHDLIPLGHYGEPNPHAPWYRAIGDKQEKTPAHGWMIGYAPSDHPKIAFAVLVEYGGGGGTAAGSVVRQLLDACIQQGYLQPDAAN